MGGKRAPNTRQKKLLEKVSDNVRSKHPKSIRVLMREVGYSDSYSDVSTRAMAADSWKELLDKYLPQDKIAKTHSQALKSFILDERLFNKDLSDDQIIDIVESIEGCKVKTIIELVDNKKCYYFVPDNRVRLSAVEMAYKLRGSFAAEKIAVTSPYEQMTDEELETEFLKLSGQIFKKNDRQ